MCVCKTQSSYLCYRSSAQVLSFQNLRHRASSTSMPGFLGNSALRCDQLAGSSLSQTLWKGARNLTAWEIFSGRSMKLLFVVAFVASVVIGVEGHWKRHKLQKLGHELGHELKKFEKIPRVLTNIKVTDGCQCVDYNCGCCGRIVVKKVKFDETICVNASYLPKEYGFRVTLTLNDLTLINQTISAKNPPPLCVGIPHVKELSVCIRFYNLSVGNFSFSGCVDLEAHVLHIIEEKYDLGCFKVGDPKLRGINDINLTNQQLKGTVPVVRNDHDDSLLFSKMRYGLNNGRKMT